MSLRGLLLIALLVSSVPVCFFRPYYGILLWTILAFLNPQAHTWTAFDAFPWAEVIAIPTILGLVIFERKFERLASREFALLVVLWLWFTVTTLVSMNHPVFVHHAADTWARWLFVSKILLMIGVTIPIVDSIERLRKLVLTICACFGFYVVKSFVFSIATGGVHRVYGPERSMIADNTDFGLALVMTLPMYFVLAHTENKRWMKRLLWSLFLITIPVIFFTYSRGALVGLTAVFGIMLLKSRRRLALVPVAVVGVVVALSFTTEAWRHRMNPTREDAVDRSAESRLLAWEYARALAAEYPITGGGFETYTEELYHRYWPEGEFRAIIGSHSVYFQILAEHGYVGLVLYLLVVASCLSTTRQLQKAARARGDVQIAQYALMFRLSLFGFLVPGFFLGRAYFDYYFTIVACITILARAARERWVTSTAETAVTGSGMRGVPSSPHAARPASVSA